MGQTLAESMKSDGLRDAHRTLLHEISKIKSGDIVLPAESAGGIEPTVRFHRKTEPEAEKKLLHRLGLSHSSVLNLPAEMQ